jgi:hypothetical protein
LASRFHDKAFSFPVFDTPPPFRIAFSSSRLQRILGQGEDSFICIRDSDSTSSNLAPASNVGSSERDQRAADVRDLFSRSNIANVTVEVGAHDRHAFNLFVVNANSVTERAGYGLAEDATAQNDLRCFRVTGQTFQQLAREGLEVLWRLGMTVGHWSHDAGLRD